LTAADDGIAVESSLLNALRFEWLDVDSIAECDPSTCDWLLKNTQWNDWLAQSAEPLWIFGAPGMGKTVLSKFILQELRRRNRQDPSHISNHVMGYFFDDRVEARRNFNGLIRALLYHFLLSNSELFRHIRGKYIATSPSLTNDYLMEILNTILEDPRLGNLDLVIEGLDECSAAIDIEMIDFISNLRKKSNVRLVVTSRPQERVKKTYLPSIIIDLDANAISPKSSIKLYIKEEIRRVLGDTSLGDSKFPDEFRREVERVLLDRESPNFLWVRLAIRYIELQRTTLLSRKAVRELPPGAKVDPLFVKYLGTEYLFHKIPLPSVYIVMEAKAPMTVLGLSFLSAATFEEQSSLIILPESKIPSLVTIKESTIKDFGYEIDQFPFLQVQENAVSLMHSSLKDILQNTFSPSNGFSNQAGKSSLTTRLLEPAGLGVEAFLAAINYFIAELCLTYLIASLQENRDPLDFLRYSTLYWFEHVQEAAAHAAKWKSTRVIVDNATEPIQRQSNGTDDIAVPKTLLTLVETLFCSDKTCNDWTKRQEGDCSVFTKWIRQYAKYDITKEKAVPEEDTRKPVAFTLAAFNLYHILGNDLINGLASDSLKAKDTNGRTPMHFIVLNNALESLKWVEERLSADSAFKQFHSLAFQSTERDPEKLENCPVYLAAEYGNKDMVELFTKSALHAPITSRRRLGRLLHSIAAKNRHKDIFLMLYKGHFLDLPPEDQQGVAESAATLDCVDEVKEIVLGNPNRISLIELLHCAIRSCAERTIHEILPLVDIDQLATSGRTALHEAAEIGNDRIVTKLLESGAFVNALDSARQTPLHLASKAGFSTVCFALLEAGARVNLADSEGSIPVHYAAGNGHDKVLSLLVAKGSNLFTADKYGRGPLHLACQSRHESSGSTVQVLLSMNARVGARDRRGRTSLHYAAQSGNKTILWMLVDAGADLSVQDDDGIAPIHLAAEGSSDVMIMELLRLGADPTVRDNENRSVYYYCMSSDRPSRAVFQVLRENNVPVNLAEISFSAKSREWLEESQVGSRSNPPTLSTQTSAASTEELLKGSVFASYAGDRAESPEGMFKDLDALSGGKRHGRSGLYVR
jgi:ankyrin repeat protein